MSTVRVQTAPHLSSHSEGEAGKGDRSDYLPAHQMTRYKLQSITITASGHCDQSEESSGSDAPEPVSDCTRSKMLKSHVASRQDVAGSSYGRLAASSVGGAGDVPATLQNAPKVNAPFIIIIGFISGTKPIANM